MICDHITVLKNPRKSHFTTWRVIRAIFILKSQKVHKQLLVNSYQLITEHKKQTEADCLKITQNIAFSFLAFSTNFCPFKK